MQPKSRIVSRRAWLGVVLLLSATFTGRSSQFYTNWAALHFSDVPAQSDYIARPSASDVLSIDSSLAQAPRRDDVLGTGIVTIETDLAPFTREVDGHR